MSEKLQTTLERIAEQQGLWSRLMRNWATGLKALPSFDYSISAVSGMRFAKQNDGASKGINHLMSDIADG